jgi:hypothetical protein
MEEIARFNHLAKTLLGGVAGRIAGAEPLPFENLGYGPVGPFRSLRIRIAGGKEDGDIESSITNLFKRVEGIVASIMTQGRPWKFGSRPHDSGTSQVAAVRMARN